MDPFRDRPPALFGTRAATVSLIAIAVAGELECNALFATVGTETVGKTWWYLGRLLAHRLVRVKNAHASLDPDYPFADEIRAVALALANHYPVEFHPQTRPATGRVIRKAAQDHPFRIFDRGMASEIPIYLAAAEMSIPESITEALGLHQPSVSGWLHRHVADRGIRIEQHKSMKLTFLNPAFPAAAEYRALLQAMVDRARPQYRAIAAAQRRRWKVLADPAARSIYKRIMKQGPSL